MFKKLVSKRVIIVVIAILVLVSFYKTATNPKNKVVAVNKVTLEKRIVKKTVSSSGSIKAVSEADLSFTASQKITQIYVKKGDEVKKGKLLAIIDNKSTLDTSQSYKDSRDKAIRQKELFVRNKDDNKDLLGGSDQYNIKLRELDEEISRTEALYNAQTASQNGAYIFAPFDGTIVDVLKSVGETATAGETIIKIADLSNLYFEADLDQEDYSQLKLDMPATISLDAFPNDTFSAKVTEIPLYINSNSNNSFILKAQFTNLGDKKPLLGMTGDIKIETQVSNGEVNSLYYDEIYEDQDASKFVWILENGYLSKLKVEIGLEGDIYTEIKSDISKEIVTPVTQDADIKEGYKAKLTK